MERQERQRRKPEVGLPSPTRRLLSTITSWGEGDNLILPLSCSESRMSLYSNESAEGIATTETAPAPARRTIGCTSPRSSRSWTTTRLLAQSARKTQNSAGNNFKPEGTLRPPRTRPRPGGRPVSRRTRRSASTCTICPSLAASTLPQRRTMNTIRS